LAGEFPSSFKAFAQGRVRRSAAGLGGCPHRSELAAPLYNTRRPYLNRLFGMRSHFASEPTESLAESKWGTAQLSVNYRFDRSS
jgi:hypothetical protein